MLTQHQPKSLHSHIKSIWQSNRTGPKVDILAAQSSSETPGRYVGTADALYQNKDYIKQQNSEYVLILSGDHVYSMDYRKLLERHIHSGADMTIATVEKHIKNAQHASVVTIDSNCKVSGINENPQAPQPLPGSKNKCLVSMGVYLFSSEFLLQQLECDKANELSTRDLARNVIPQLIQKAQVYAYPFTDKKEPSYWREVSSLDAYWQTQMDFLNNSATDHLQNIEKPIQPHSPPLLPQTRLQQSAHCHGWVAMSLLHQTDHLMGARINQSVLNEGVRVGERSFVHKSLLLAGSTVGENCHIQRTIIENGCVIPDDTIIGFDLERDALDFHVTESGIVVVTTEMLDSRQRRNERMAA